MGQVKIEHQPDQQRLQELGVNNWAIWEKEVSEFPWHYDVEETCYFLAGEVVVTSEDGERFVMGKGDLVTFSRGLSCTWSIKLAVKKHYTFA